MLMEAVQSTGCDAALVSSGVSSNISASGSAMIRSVTPLPK